MTTMRITEISESYGVDPLGHLYHRPSGDRWGYVCPAASAVDQLRARGLYDEANALAAARLAKSEED